MTHGAIANHLETHREVVVRMLRYLRNKGLVRLSRRSAELTDFKKLASLGNI
nr:helix-turn-helix domain-containing protein [uncultured Oscillibacter sp.]